MKYLDLNYIFDASAQTVQITDWFSGTLKKEGIKLITNVTDGIIIYNPYSSTAGFNGTITPDAGGDILTLDYDTTSMSDTDALSIEYDDGAYPASENTLGAISSDISDVLNRLPTSIGQNAKANSLSVALASDQDALPITDNGGSLTVDGTVTIQDGGNVISVDDGGGNISIDDGGNSITVDGTVAISNASIPVTDNGGSLTVDFTQPALVAGTAIIGKVGIDQTTPGTTNGVQVNAALPAGTNNIGDVDVLTLPALPAGTNNIGDVDVLTVPADPFGTNADAAVAAGATGSMQAKFRRMTQGLEDLKTLIVLAAGTNAIGKLSANSGVDIGDVDVTSLPATPAGTNLIGKVAAQHSTSAMSNGTTDVTPKFAKIDRATNADGAAVVSLVSAKKIRVLTLTMVSAGTVSLKWQSSTSNSTGAGSNTDLTGLMSLVANTGMADVFSPVGLFETVAGEALKLNLNAAVQVSGYLTYLEI